MSGYIASAFRSKKPRHQGEERFPRYADFNSPLHLQWKRDQSLRRLVPLMDTFRHCLGIGTTFEVGVQPIVRGKSLIYPSESVTFHAVRDVPPRHFTGIQGRRNVTYVSRAKAKIYSGAPQLRFDQDLRSAIDLQMMPYDKLVLQPNRNDEFGAKPEVIRPEGDVLDSESRATEFALINSMSEEMTRYAFFGLADDGRPVCPAWLRARTKLTKMNDEKLAQAHLSSKDVQWLMTNKPFQNRHPRTWLPKPYLRFKLPSGADLGDWLAQTFWKATESEGRVDVIECPVCHAKHDMQVFGLHDDSGITMVKSPLKVEFIDIDRFIAKAPCGCRGKTRDGRMVWHMDDIRPGRIRRRFTAAFKGMFCDAVADGLPFVAPCDCTYLAAERSSVRTEGGGLLDAMDVEAHRFVSTTGREFSIYAPHGSKVNVKPSTKMKAGEVFFRPLGANKGALARGWGRQSLNDRWDSLSEVLGGSRWVGFAQQQWFANQAIVDGDEVLLPFTLIGAACRDLQPSGLSWDFGRLVGRMDKDRTLCVMPVLELNHWNRLRRTLPFDIELDASIFDTRFSAERRESWLSQQPVEDQPPTPPEPKHQTVQLVNPDEFGEHVTDVEGVEATVQDPIEMSSVAQLVAQLEWRKLAGVSAC